MHPAKLGLVGHGFGGSAAVFAAAGLTGTHVKSVAAIFPTVTNPAAEQPAATLDVPGLILTAPGDPKTLTSNALRLSRLGIRPPYASSAKPEPVVWLRADD